MIKFALGVGLGFAGGLIVGWLFGTRDKMTSCEEWKETGIELGIKKAQRQQEKQVWDREYEEIAAEEAEKITKRLKANAQHS